MVSLATAISRSAADSEEGSCQNYSPRGNPSLLRARQAPLHFLLLSLHNFCLSLGHFPSAGTLSATSPGPGQLFPDLMLGLLFPRIGLPIFKELQPTCTARDREQVLSVISSLGPI